MLTFTSKFAEMYNQQTKKTVPVFETIEGFVEGISRNASPDVKLENMGTLFFYFAVFLILVTVAFLVDILLLRKLKKIKRQLVRLLARLAILVDAIIFSGSRRVAFRFTPTNL